MYNPDCENMKLLIVGSIPDLGDWDPEKGLELEK